MTEDIYQKLAAPFDVTHKKQGLDYLTGEQVTSRLNEALGWDAWSFRVLEHGYNEEADELWCLGELTIARMVPATPIIRQQFGSQKPNRYSEKKDQNGKVLNPATANKIIDYGFDLKGAATDALKKCASLIGVGLYLHEKDSPSSGPVARPAEGARQVPNGAAKGREDHVAVASQPPAAPPPQKGFFAVAREMGFTDDEILAESQTRFENREPKQLTPTERTQLIVFLEETKAMKKEAVSA